MEAINDAGFFFAKHDVTSGSEWNCCWQEQICKSWEISAPMSTMALTGVVRWQNNELKWHSLFTRFVCLSINAAHSTIDAGLRKQVLHHQLKKQKNPRCLALEIYETTGEAGLSMKIMMGRKEDRILSVGIVEPPRHLTVKLFSYKGNAVSGCRV